MMLTVEAEERSAKTFSAALFYNMALVQTST
jgi:hypothetical protein